MKFKAKVTTVGNGKGFIVPKNMLYEDYTEIRKGDNVVVEIRKINEWKQEPDTTIREEHKFLSCAPPGNKMASTLECMFESDDREKGLIK